MYTITAHNKWGGDMAIALGEWRMETVRCINERYQDITELGYPFTPEITIPSSVTILRECSLERDPKTRTDTIRTLSSMGRFIISLPHNSSDPAIFESKLHSNKKDNHTLVKFSGRGEKAQIEVSQLAGKDPEQLNKSRLLRGVSEFYLHYLLKEHLIYPTEEARSLLFIIDSSRRSSTQTSASNSSLPSYVFDYT